MPLRSAPSAKIFTFKWSTDGDPIGVPLWALSSPQTGPEPTLIAPVQDNPRGLGKCGNDLVGLARCFRFMAVINENRRAAGLPARCNIAPAVADDVACRQVDAALGGGFKQHAGLRLAARAIVRVDVK